ncbi:hypothetical protein [Actinocrinis sp.]|uniref:hypothetical protein n=1 Tax=Actinocrinis sp. TaxID=1920516 RepID=UPI002D491877|nr:hypothetical protein [Actinocrinis sp.]HZP53193.1 hypothetical protein [Actinocrinis sp.]
MRLQRWESVRLPVGRVRFAGVGLAVLGAVALGLAVVPACGGGGATGDNVVYLQNSGAHLVGVAAAVSIAPDAQGGGGVGDN